MQHVWGEEKSACTMAAAYLGRFRLAVLVQDAVLVGAWLCSVSCASADDQQTLMTAATDLT